MKGKVKLMHIVMCIMQEFNFLHKTIETLMLYKKIISTDFDLD